MSFRIMGAVMGTTFSSINKKMVMLCLADRINDDLGFGFPSLKRIAVDCCISVATVKRTIKTLEEECLISIERSTKDGIKQVNKYRVNVSLLGSDRANGKLTVNPRVGSEGAINLPLEPIIEPKDILRDIIPSEKERKDWPILRAGGVDVDTIKYKGWRKDQSVYKKYFHFYEARFIESEEYDNALSRYNNIDIDATLQNIKDYWLSDDGYKAAKRGGALKLDWIRRIKTSFNMAANRLYLPR